MKEIVKGKFFDELNKYVDCNIDYFIYEIDDYLEEESHKDAIVMALEKCECDYDIDKATYKEISKEELFKIPTETIKWKEFTTIIYNDKLFGDNLSYYYAFTNSPFGTCNRIIKSSSKNGDNIIKREYSEKDFNKINKLLFPDGIDNLVIYKWSNDFSDYFELGNEWFGSFLYSIYDKKSNRIILIMTSTSD